MSEITARHDYQTGAKHSRSYSASGVNVRGTRAGISEALERRDVSRTHIARFLSKFDKGSGCWLWKAGKFHHGYGMFNLGRDYRGKQHTTYAHRVAYVLEHGDIPAGMVVMHTCDVTSCVNPAHLKLGTQRENIRDASAKGRLPKTRQRRKAA